MKILELFAGYGSQALALKYLGYNVESEISEIDKYAISAYQQLHGETKNWGDITKIDEKELGEYDLITYSSPCQDFSFAGLQKGGEEGSGTRSSLLWECKRIISQCKPKYLLMENVKALTSKKFMPCFQRWLDILNDLGYDNYWKILNAKDFGVPQNRERVFVVSIRKDLDMKDYKFPEKEELKLRLKNLLEEKVDEKYYLTEKQVSAFNQAKTREQDVNGVCQTLPIPHRLFNIYGEDKGTGYAGNVWDKDGLSPTLMTMTGGNRQPMIIDGGVKIRKLTPRECWRLMGVRDEDFNKIKGISNSQLYKLAGNSIVVQVLMRIFEALHLEFKMREN